MRLRSFIVATLIAVAGCSQFPELEASVTDETRDAPYPKLVPLETLQARIGDERITPEMGQTVQVRATRLKSRAARLRRTIIDDSTRSRMRNGVDT